MKKIFTLAAALMLSVGIFAESMPWACGCYMYEDCSNETCYSVFLLRSDYLSDLGDILSKGNWADYAVSVYNFKAGDANSEGFLAPSKQSEVTGAIPVPGASYFALFIVCADVGSAEATHYLTVEGEYYNGFGFYSSDYPATWNSLSSSENVPEPTSGLFLLLGASILALKRKK